MTEININKTKKLIDIYHNSGDIQSLCITLSYDLVSDFILIGWYIMENIWYMPMIYIKMNNGNSHEFKNDINGW